MPEVDGYEATGRICLQEVFEQRQPTPIIALTAMALLTLRFTTALTCWQSFLTPVLSAIATSSGVDSKAPPPQPQ